MQSKPGSICRLSCNEKYEEGKINQLVNQLYKRCNSFGKRIIENRPNIIGNTNL